MDISSHYRCRRLRGFPASSVGEEKGLFRQSTKLSRRDECFGIISGQKAVILFPRLVEVEAGAAMSLQIVVAWDRGFLVNFAV